MAAVDSTLTMAVAECELPAAPQGAGAAVLEPTTSLDDPGRDAARAFGEVLAEAGDREGLDAVLRPATVALCGLLGVGRCSLYLRDGRTGRYKGRLAHPAAYDRFVSRLTVGGPSDTLTADVLTARRPVAVQDVRDDPRTARSVIRETHVRSMLVVPLVHDARVLGLLYADDEGRRRHFSPRDLAVAEAFAELVARWVDRSLRVAQLAVARDELARERTVMRRATQVERRLAEVASAPFQDVLQTIAVLAGRPVEVLGATGESRARAVPPAVDRGPAVGLRGAKLLLSRLADAVPGTARVVEPDLGRGLTHRCVATPLTLENGEGGLLVLVERDSRLGPFDGLLAARAAGALAAAGRERHAVDVARDDARALIVTQVLSQGLHPENGTALATRLGVEAAAPRIVATVRSALPIEHGALVAAVAPHPAVAVRLEDGIALVAELPRDVPQRVLSAAVRDGVVGVLRGAGASGVVAVSAVCRDLEGLPRALRQARALAATAPRAEPDGVVGLTVDELGPARLLLTDPADAGRMGEDVLGPLLDPDPSTRDLLRTLVTFFAVGSSIRATATALEVHENTVRHRFGRVRTMTGLDVAGCVDDQLMARAALSALRLSGSAAVLPDAAD